MAFFFTGARALWGIEAKRAMIFDASDNFSSDFFDCMTNPSFRDARLKIIRANQHIADIEMWVEHFIELHRQKPRFKIDRGDTSNGGKFQLFVLDSDFPEVDLAALVGDAIHNLRSALDYAASAILVQFGVDPMRSYFPIDNNRQSLIGKPSFREIERLSPEFARVILKHIGDSNTSNILVTMNHLDRADKHRRLIVAESHTAFRIISIDDENDPLGYPRDAFVVLPDSRAPSIGSMAHLHNEANCHSAGQIVFGKGEPIEGKPIVPTLFQMSQAVELIVHELESCSH